MPTPLFGVSGAPEAAILQNSLLNSLLAGSLTSKINDLYDTLATVATVIGDGWSGLKPDNSINPFRMLQRRALVAACGALGAPPHRANDTVICHQPLELLAGVLAATIGVMQQRIGLAASPDRHRQRVTDELSCHRSAHRPADDTPREEIDDGRHIEPALCRPHIREVGNPFAVGRRRFEGAIEHVGSDGGGLPLTQIGRQAMPSRTRSESL
jgi:hypothetical protein